MAYCLAMVLMFFKVFRMDGIGSLNLSSSSFIDGMCVVAQAHAVITMSGSIFQPRATMFSNSGLYLLALTSSVYGENLSLQYVNYMNYMVKVLLIFWGKFFTSYIGYLTVILAIEPPPPCQD